MIKHVGIFQYILSADQKHICSKTLLPIDTMTTDQEHLSLSDLTEFSRQIRLIGVTAKQAANALRRLGQTGYLLREGLRIKR